MSPTKFFATWQKQDGTLEVIDAFKALRLRDNAKIITKDKEKAVLFDIDTKLKVFPNKSRLTRNASGQPFFSYYPDEESPLKDQSSSFEQTPQLNAFLQAFEQIKCFQIKEFNEDPISIFVEHSRKLHRITLGDEYFIVKIFIQLKETRPYSYYYKFNGQLALEFLVTSRLEPIKIVELSNAGIPLFEAKAKIPKWTEKKLPKLFTSENEFKAAVDDIVDTYENRNYQLFGKFPRENSISKEYKGGYEKLHDLEKQIKELESKRDSLIENVEVQKKESDKLLAQSNEYKKRNDYHEQLRAFNEKLINDKEILLNDKKSLAEAKGQLATQNSKLTNANAKLKAKNIELKSQKSQLEQNFQNLKYLSIFLIAAALIVIFLLIYRN